MHTLFKQCWNVHRNPQVCPCNPNQFPIPALLECACVCGSTFRGLPAKSHEITPLTSSQLDTCQIYQQRLPYVGSSKWSVCILIAYIVSYIFLACLSSVTYYDVVRNLLDAFKWWSMLSILNHRWAIYVRMYRLVLKVIAPRWPCLLHGWSLNWQSVLNGRDFVEYKPI